MDECTDQIAGLRRLEQDWTFERAELPSAETAYGALAGNATNVDGSQEIVGRARCRVPVIALHRAVGFADDGAIDRMARASIAAAESGRVRVNEFRFTARNAGAFGVRDPRIDGERRGFGRPAELDRIVDSEIPRMIEIEIGPRVRKQRRIRESRARVCRREARDRERLVDGGANRVVG